MYINFFIYFRRERKYFPVHKMSKRMSNTLRRIYKHNNILCDQGYPSAPEHQTSLSENTPESPVKNELHAELNESRETKAIIVVPPKNSKNTINHNGNATSVSPKISNQKKIRHRRLGSTDSNYTFILSPKQMDRRNIKMVHMETQTDIDDHNIEDANQNVSNINYEIYELDKNEDKFNSAHDEEQQETANHQINENENENNKPQEVCDDNAKNLIYDYMNSNEQLSSDEDNVEKLNSRVSQFFTENHLLKSPDNGNGNLQLLFNIMAARRSCISIKNKDEVTVLSRGNNSQTIPTATVYSAHAHGDTIRHENLNYKLNDPNCNNDDGDDSWTDEEGEDSDHGYSLRRKR